MRKLILLFVLSLYSCMNNVDNVKDKFKSVVPPEGILSNTNKEHASMIICVDGENIFMDGLSVKENFTEEDIIDKIATYSLEEIRMTLIIHIFYLNVDFEGYDKKYQKVKNASNKYMDSLSMKMFSKEYKQISKEERKLLGTNIVLQDSEVDGENKIKYCK